MTTPSIVLKNSILLQIICLFVCLSTLCGKRNFCYGSELSRRLVSIHLQSYIEIRLVTVAHLSLKLFFFGEIFEKIEFNDSLKSRRDDRNIREWLLMELSYFISFNSIPAIISATNSFLKGKNLDREIRIVPEFKRRWLQLKLKSISQDLVQVH